MTVEIIIRNRGVNDIIDIVSRLRSDGWTLGKDFDYAYYPGRWDGMIGDVPASTKFTFYTEKYASLFSLKYGS